MAPYRATSNVAGPPIRYSIAIAGNDRHRRLFEGAIKFRLGHSLGRSYVVPEVLFAVGGTRFYLPSMFGPPLFGFNVEPGKHRLRFNLDVGHPRASELVRLIVEVKSEDRVRCYGDGAQLYRCTIDGPRLIARAASGLCRATPDGDFVLRLFHHTTPSSAEKIRESGELWSSPWNLAGTRKLGNVAYTYFTTLPCVSDEADLHRIAMASNGEIHFQTTSDRIQEETLALQVYRSSTQGRTTALCFEVATALIAPPPLLFHPMTRENFAAYYEIVGPEIVRVGLQPGGKLPFLGERVTAHAEDLKRFDYLVLGNAATLDGLAAPYEEEETKEVTHLERLVDQDVFEFWLAHQNQDLFSDRNIEAKVLEANEKSKS